MIFHGEDDLSCAFNYISMEVTVRSINLLFRLLRDELLGKLLSDKAFVAAAEQFVQVLVQVHGMELPLKGDLLLGFCWVLL